MIAEELRSDGEEYRRELVGFLDDDLQLIGDEILGLPVLGSSEEVAQQVREHHGIRALVGHAIAFSRANFSNKILEFLKRFITRAICPITSIGCTNMVM